MSILLYYFHGVISGDFAYMLVFLAVAAFGAGRILCLDAWIESYVFGGKTLIERYRSSNTSSGEYRMAVRNAIDQLLSDLGARRARAAVPQPRTERRRPARDD